MIPASIQAGAAPVRLRGGSEIRLATPAQG